MFQQGKLSCPRTLFRLLHWTHVHLTHWTPRLDSKVTFPLYFFTKIIYCNQDWSDKPCPDVTKTLHDTWMLLLWPVYMVCTGE